MRHRFFVNPESVPTGCPPFAGAISMFEAPGAAALVALARFALAALADELGATFSAVPLPSVTVAADDHLRPAPCAQKHPTWLIAHWRLLHPPVEYQRTKARPAWPPMGGQAG